MSKRKIRGVRLDDRILIKTKSDGTFEKTNIELAKVIASDFQKLKERNFIRPIIVGEFLDREIHPNCVCVMVWRFDKQVQVRTPITEEELDELIKDPKYAQKLFQLEHRHFADKIESI